LLFRRFNDGSLPAKVRESLARAADELQQWDEASASAARFEWRREKKRGPPPRDPLIHKIMRRLQKK
jgi:hypothetical protein